VKTFYREAARNPREDILNPVHYPEDLVDHIPEASRVRSYGCGSPVIDADLREGETVVDLGSGSGVECYIAARLVGPTGRVIGIDMLDSMLDLSRGGADAVAERLGYRNLEFGRNRGCRRIELRHQSLDEQAARLRGDPPNPPGRGAAAGGRRRLRDGAECGDPQ
jgi:SAM-dependent methyltransferase